MDSKVQVDSSLQPTYSQVEESFVSGFIGVVISTVVFGITILQAYIYFGSGRNDSKRMRSFVAFLFILDTTSWVLSIGSFYDTITTNLGNMSLGFEFPLVSSFETGITTLIGTLTQCFFADRLWGLSRQNILLVGSIVILSLASFGLEITFCVYGYKNPVMLTSSSVELRVLGGLSSGLAMVCDVVILAALSYCLHSKRTGFKRTDSVINQLIIYAINRGALTSICQAALTILFVVSPERLYYIPFSFLTGKLYCNTLLATLNAQMAMRSNGEHVVEIDTIVLNQINTSTTGNGNIRRTHLESANRSAPTFVVEISAGKGMDSARTQSSESNV